MTSTPNLLDHRPPCENRGYVFGDDSNYPHNSARLASSPLVNYLIPDYLWGSNIFADTNVVQPSTTNELHPFGRTFPVATDTVSSLLSLILNSTDNPGGQPIPWMLGSLFQLAPAILSSAPHADAPPRLELVNEGRPDKGKGKARDVDSYHTKQPAPEPAPFEDDTFADTLREVMASSKRVYSRTRSLDEAGPSGSSASAATSSTAPPPLVSTSLPQTHPSGSDSEQTEIDHAILVSSIEDIENSFLALQANFTFPTRLDFRVPSDTGSHVSSSTDGDDNGCIVAYLPTTPTNSTVLNFTRDLRGLLLQLDHTDINNDMEVEAVKAKVVGAINQALEDVECEVEEAVGRWISLQATGTGVTGCGSLMIFG